MKNNILGNLFGDAQKRSVARNSENIQENFMFTKKKVVRTALLLVGAYTLTGCGGSHAVPAALGTLGTSQVSKSLARPKE